MAGKGAPQSRAGDGFVIQLNLLGIVIFSVALVAAASLVMYGFMSAHAVTTDRLAPAHPSAGSPSRGPDVPPTEIPAWGELRTTDVELEQPEEYIAFEMNTNQAPAWVFSGLGPEQTKTLMLSCGMSPAQVDRALAPALVSATPSSTIIHPDDELILSLSPDTRSKLYTELSRDATNHYMRFPFHFTDESLDDQFVGSGVNPEIVAVMKKLVYARGETECFSDYEEVLRRIPSESERLSFAKALTRQSAVLPHLRIRPDTDIDKLLGYWGRGVQVMDVRPLLESLKRLPDGGSVSLLYLLPPFARERLYTFPLPGKPDDPAMDCHWSTMNFFNDPPDNRFANPPYTTAFLLEHYYVVAKPTQYGDVVLVLDEHGNAIHSGVYLAADIIFTKNGNNCSQPWKLMRLKDLMDMYAMSPAAHLAVYRDKSR